MSTEEDFIALLSTGEPMTINNNHVIKFDNILLFLHNNVSEHIYFKYCYHQHSHDCITLRLLTANDKKRIAPSAFICMLDKKYAKINTKDFLSVGFKLTKNDYGLATIILYNSISENQKKNMILLLNSNILIDDIRKYIITYTIEIYKELYWLLYNLC